MTLRDRLKSIHAKADPKVTICLCVAFFGIAYRLFPELIMFWMDLFHVNGIDQQHIQRGGSVVALAGCFLALLAYRSKNRIRQLPRP